MLVQSAQVECGSLARNECEINVKSLSMGHARFPACRVDDVQEDILDDAGFTVATVIQRPHHYSCSPDLSRVHTSKAAAGSLSLRMPNFFMTLFALTLSGTVSTKAYTLGSSDIP